jgi:hypothetical protein
MIDQNNEYFYQTAEDLEALRTADSPEERNNIIDHSMYNLIIYKNLSRGFLPIDLIGI